MTSKLNFRLFPYVYDPALSSNPRNSQQRQIYLDTCSQLDSWKNWYQKVKLMPYQIKRR